MRLGTIASGLNKDNGFTTAEIHANKILPAHLKVVNTVISVTGTPNLDSSLYGCHQPSSYILIQPTDVHGITRHENAPVVLFQALEGNTPHFVKVSSYKCVDRGKDSLGKLLFPFHLPFL